MKLLIAGGTGFIGRNLCKHLHQEGHQLFVITREPKKAQIEGVEHYISWEELDREGLPENTDGIINLCGATIAHYLSESYKKVLHDSRVETTKKLVSAAYQYKGSIKIFINASATGYYPTIEGPFNEKGPNSHDYLGQLSLLWEGALLESLLTSRKVCLRLGLILGKGGAIEKMLPAFKLGLGGRIGSGKQIMPWLHIEDLCDVISLILEDEKIEGPINCVNNEVITNEEFTRTLAQRLRRPAIFPIPAFVLKFILKEASPIMLEGTEIQPQVLNELGFKFKYPSLKKAFDQIL